MSEGDWGYDKLGDNGLFSLNCRRYEGDKAGLSEIEGKAILFEMKCVDNEGDKPTYISGITAWGVPGLPKFGFIDVDLDMIN